MIAVSRPSVEASVETALAKRNAATGLSELEWAMWHFADVEPVVDPLPARPQHPPEFSAYGDAAVKQALHELFGGHCAYCESRYDHVSPMDVEHYRPKSAVIEDDGVYNKPGYYWLAADWDNLLPSCIGCNRARSQELILPDETYVIATSGKGNRFPLRPGSVRAKAPGAEAIEQPMLLDPCRCDPKPHLLFRSDGYVEPRPSEEEKENARGMDTIEVCGLHRASLIESRRRAATRLRDAMENLLSADDDIRRHPGDPRYETRRETREVAMSNLIADLDYRALSKELCDLFANARKRINAYCASEARWQATQTADARKDFVMAARSINLLFRNAGLHQPFIRELFGLADIPLDQLSDT